MAAASLDQKSFRCRNDDGNETTATWIDTENTNITQITATTFRVRFVVACITGSSRIWIPAIFASYNGGAYAIITTSTNVIKAVTSSNVADGTVTTNQLTLVGTFLAGEVSNDGISPSVTIANGQCQEYEYILQIVDADVNDGDTIDLRMYAFVATALNFYTNTPRITVSKSLPTITGDLTKTEDDDTISSTAKVIITANASITEEDDTVSSTETVTPRPFLTPSNKMNLGLRLGLP